MLAGSTGYDVVDIASVNLPALHSERSLPEARQGQTAELVQSRSRDHEGPRRPRSRQRICACPTCGAPTGITYNVDMVKERLPECRPQIASISCSSRRMPRSSPIAASTSWNSPGDVIPMVLAYLGQAIPIPTKPEDYEAVVEAFKPSASISRPSTTANYLNAIPNKELCVIDNLVGRLCHRQGPRQGSRRRDQSRLSCAASRARRPGSTSGHSGRCAQQGECPQLPQLHDGPGSHRQMHQLHQLCQCQSRRPNKFVDPGVLEDPAVYPSDDIKKTLCGRRRSLIAEVERRAREPGTRSRQAR